jgi:hypothetical protein
MPEDQAEDQAGDQVSDPRIRKLLISVVVLFILTFAIGAFNLLITLHLNDQARARDAKILANEQAVSANEDSISKLQQQLSTAVTKDLKAAQTACSALPQLIRDEASQSAKSALEALSAHLGCPGS